MKVLHFVKTSEGARWAALQVRELVHHGIDVHVVLPDRFGALLPFWRTTGAELHFADINLPVTRPWLVPAVLDKARRLIAAINPDVIHSHHVTTTLSLRMALGRSHPVPRIFQVPGPLHLEHGLYRNAEIRLAASNDYWIGSSRYITELYQAAGVPAQRVFLSYYGHEIEKYARERTHVLRSRLGLNKEIVIGNINLIYPPKYHVGQTVGLKCHEDVIEALGIVIAKRPDVAGVLVGGTFGSLNTRYEMKLRRYAQRVGRGRIHMPGRLPLDIVAQAWPDFDLAVHVPLSENCGGVVEPLLAGVPVIAARVGGLPEVIMPDLTGQLVRNRHPEELAQAIFTALDHYDRCKLLAQNGQLLVGCMVDVRRTAREVAAIYDHILHPETARPPSFDSQEYVKNRLARPEQAVGAAAI